MFIRRAIEGDIERILELLSQVLEVHANVRPDIFISGKTKYTHDELINIINKETTPIYVAVENERVVGYVFCEIREQPPTNVVKKFKYIYIDDLCVDESLRNQNVGSELFEFVKAEAKKLDCYEITLNVWELSGFSRAFSGLLVSR